MTLLQIGRETEGRADLPLLVALAQPMPSTPPSAASGPKGEATKAEWGTHVPTGPGDNYKDINKDYSFDD